MHCFLGVLLAISAFAQAPSVPLVDPRGVVDAYNPSTVPATVARGGILQINGTDLGPATTVTAAKAPLPVSLGNPAVQVMLNGTAIPLLSVNQNQIMAQVPIAAPVGTVSVVVSVGGTAGPAVNVTIAATQPAIRTADASGTGLYAGVSTATTVTLAVSGLGVTRPALADGALPPDNRVTPTTPVVAYIGGVRTTATATASIKNVGEFDVVLDIPASAQPGDLIYLVSGGKPSNAVLYQALSAPALQVTPLPSGSPDFVSVATPDVSGSFLIPFAAKDATGCSSALWFDMKSGNSGPLNSCLAFPSRTATSPLVLPPDSEIAGALVGPPDGTPPAGISSNVLIADADNDSLTNVALSSDASALTGTVGASFLATIPGTPAQTESINGITGAVNTINAGAGGAGAAGGAGGAAITSVNVNGLTYVVTTPVQVAAGQFGLVATDDPQSPTQAVYAVVQANGTVLASQTFPTGWLPLIPAKPTAGAAATLESARFDATSKSVYLLVRAPDASRDAFLSLPYDASATPSVIPVPAGWFATSCAGTVKLTAVTSYAASVFPGSNVAETGYSNPCNAAGFLVLDLSSSSVTSYSLGFGAQFNAATLANFNDYIYGTDLNKNLSSTIYVFDADSSDAYEIDLPAGAPSFAAVQSVAGRNWLLAELTTRTAGDGGLVQFDLDAGTATLFPIPSGFTSVQFLGAFLATGKLAVRGLAAGAYHFLVYDLQGNVTSAPNPNGVASFGPPPAAAGAAGAAAAVRLPVPVANPKANTLSTIAYDASGNQIGVLLAQVP